MVELVDGWQEMDDRKKTALVMDLTCGDDRIGSAVDRIWRSQFGWNSTTNNLLFHFKDYYTGDPISPEG